MEHIMEKIKQWAEDDSHKEFIAYEYCKANGLNMIKLPTTVNNSIYIGNPPKNPGKDVGYYSYAQQRERDEAQKKVDFEREFYSRFQSNYAVAQRCGFCEVYTTGSLKCAGCPSIMCQLHHYKCSSCEKLHLCDNCVVTKYDKVFCTNCWKLYKNMSTSKRKHNKKSKNNA